MVLLSDVFVRGNDFLRPMIISERSKLEGRENVDKIEEYIQRGDNVIFLSNHQTEADPQVRPVTALLLPLPRYL